MIGASVVCIWSASRVMAIIEKLQHYPWKSYGMRAPFWSVWPVLFACGVLLGFQNLKAVKQGGSLFESWQWPMQSRQELFWHSILKICDQSQVEFLRFCPIECNPARHVTCKLMGGGSWQPVCLKPSISACLKPSLRAASVLQMQSAWLKSLQSWEDVSLVHAVLAHFQS